MAVNRSLGEIIREGRERAGLTQSGLADRVGVTAGLISKAEAGRCSISATLSRSLIRMLDLSPSEVEDAIDAYRGKEIDRRLQTRKENLLGEQQTPSETSLDDLPSSTDADLESLLMEVRNAYSDPNFRGYLRIQMDIYYCTRKARKGEK